MKINFAAVEDTLREVGATTIMPHYKKLQAGDIETKADESKVTFVDKAAEAALKAGLTSSHPGSVCIGEESYEKTPEIISFFDGKKDVWVIDPIDGTRNFINGTPEFGEMVSLVRNKKTIAAWIHDPNTGDMLMAERGGGLWLNGQKMRLAAHDPNPPEGGLVTYMLYQSWLAHMPSSATPGPEVEIGSAACFNYARLFTGDAVFAKSEKPRMSFMLCGDSKPWDHLAGQMMLKEVGGYARDLLGMPYDMKAEKNNGILCAPDRPAWKKIHQRFHAVIKDFANK